MLLDRFSQRVILYLEIVQIELEGFDLICQSGDLAVELSLLLLFLCAHLC